MLKQTLTKKAEDKLKAMYRPLADAIAARALVEFAALQEADPVAYRTLEVTMDSGRISPQNGVCFPPIPSIVVYCPLFDRYCDAILLHFVCPCIVRVFHVFRMF